MDKVVKRLLLKSMCSYVVYVLYVVKEKVEQGSN